MKLCFESHKKCRVTYAPLPPKSQAILFLQIYQSPAGEAKRVPHISAIFQIYDCASKQLKQTTLERLLHVVGAQVACPNSL